MLPPFIRRFSVKHSPTKFNILFLGQDEFSCTIFKQLHAATDLWRDIWVATNPDAKTGRRGKYLSVSPLKLLAHALNVSSHDLPRKGLGMKTWEVPGHFLKNRLDPANILVTASIGRIIPTRILDLFNHARRLNVHPSLVPLYRGPAPIQHAIVDGRTETGVSVLNLEPYSRGLDSGDVWASRAVKIPPRATFPSLRDNLAEEGADLLISTMRAMAMGTAAAVAQDFTQTTLAPLIKRNFTQINWESWDAYRLDRVHRAAHHHHALVTILPYSPTLQLEQFTIHSPPAPLHPALQQPGDAIFDSSTESIVVRCADRTEISVDKLQQENKRVLGAKDFWNGIRSEGLQNGILKLRSFPP